MPSIGKDRRGRVTAVSGIVGICGASYYGKVKPLGGIDEALRDTEI
jgi:hypothetical protein